MVFFAIWPHDYINNKCNLTYKVNRQCENCKNPSFPPYGFSIGSVATRIELFARPFLLYVYIWYVCVTHNLISPLVLSVAWLDTILY